MHAKFSQEDSNLIADLHALAKRSPKLVKSSTYVAPADPEIMASSWKMNEFKYYDVPSPFPTLARGLFTIQLPSDASEPKYRIVARGYDKFFNIGEVPWTTWPSLEAHTAAPYTLSLKSNGCIIFIGALTPEKLVVTSKHSLGPVGNAEMSHAQAGEMWLKKYLAEKQRTEADLAARLWENNWTAIAELCDDNFEEHVLAYPPEKTGLHLHGLNTSTKTFATMPHTQVDAFAEEWGFIPTPTHTVNSIKEVREFTEAVSSAGEWNGEAVEGFVVRTHVTKPLTAAPPDMHPYAPGSSFFFKVKFDEPYMMYRDWREVTKILLAAKAKGNKLSPALLPKNKLKRAETKGYVKWVIEEIHRDPQAFKDYTKGKGIISTREKYLSWLESDKGKKEIASMNDDDDLVVDRKNSEKKKWEKTILMPIAVPGCGKTSVAVALAQIFGFAHTQSDDVQVKKAAPAFLKNVKALLDKNDVVIADKNNHLKQHRMALRQLTSEYPASVRVVALNWNLDKPPATMHRICSDRILERGSNHQSLRADPSAKSHEDTIWMFINTSEEFSESEADECIDMEVEDGMEASIRRAARGVAQILGLEPPSEEKIQHALGVVAQYQPKTKKPDEVDKTGGKGKKGAPRYYAFLPELDLHSVLEAPISNANIPPEAKSFWDDLKRNSRVTSRPHVTIVHEKSLPGESDLWERSGAIHRLPAPPLFKGTLGNVIWNDRVMAVTIEAFELETTVETPSGETAQEGREFVSKLPGEVRRRLHITVGTKEASISPVEAMTLTENWREGKSESSVYSLKLEPVTVLGRVKGMVN